MSSKVITILLFIFLASCDKENLIEKTLINKPNEYWIIYDFVSTSHFYFKFNSNKICNRYVRDEKQKFHISKGYADVSEESQRWSITSDSILRFNGFEYDIISYNDEVFTLFTYDDFSKKPKVFFLVKEKENILRKQSYFYYHKRMKFPDKYKTPDSFWTPAMRSVP